MAGNRYSNQAWQQHRQRILLRDMFTCQMCGVMLTNGKKSSRSAVVDHKQPAELRPDLFLNDDNTWAVCKRCHDTTCASIEARLGNNAQAIRQAKEAHRSGFDADGRPIW